MNYLEKCEKMCNRRAKIKQVTNKRRRERREEKEKKNENRINDYTDLHTQAFAIQRIRTGTRTKSYSGIFVFLYDQHQNIQQL